MKILRKNGLILNEKEYDEIQSELKNVEVIKLDKLAKGRKFTPYKESTEDFKIKDNILYFIPTKADLSMSTLMTKKHTTFSGLKKEFKNILPKDSNINLDNRLGELNYIIL